MENPYQPPKADVMSRALRKRSFLSALNHASEDPAIAWGFWERGRVLYGIVLLLVTAFMMVVVRPESLALFKERIGRFFVYVFIANLLYSSAYVIELIALLFRLERVNPTLRYLMLFGGTFLAVFFAILVLLYGLLSIND